VEQLEESEARAWKAIEALAEKQEKLDDALVVLLEAQARTEERFQEVGQDMKEGFREMREGFRETKERFRETDARIAALSANLDERIAKLGASLHERIGKLVSAIRRAGAARQRRQMNWNPAPSR
jgi:flagellar biosynthesis/type III secretory pathway protein FliH